MIKKYIYLPMAFFIQVKRTRNSLKVPQREIHYSIFIEEKNHVVTKDYVLEIF